VGNEVLEGLGVEQEKVAVVLNKIDLLEPGSTLRLPNGRSGVQVSARTGDGLQELVDVLRQRLLSAAGVSILRVPLQEARQVERVIALPHQVARRFRESVVEVAVRVDGRRLAEAGLDGFRVDAWESTGVSG
jgi:50S ribosomal subunit-associated GTPase HflX